MAESVREAVLSDAGALAAVHVAAWRETYRGLVADGHLDRMSVGRRASQWRRSLGLPRPGVSILVVEDSDGLAGFGMAGPQREDDRTADAEVYALYLLRRVQGRGWGTRLMAMLAARMREWGAASLDLWVLEGNTGAVAFYERLGGIRGETRSLRIARRLLRESAFVWPSIGRLIAAA